MKNSNKPLPDGGINIRDMGGGEEKGIKRIFFFKGKGKDKIEI